MKPQRIISSIILIVAFAAVFGFGFWAGKAQVVCRVCAPETVNFSLFWEAWNKVRDTYVNPADFDTQKLIYGAISGMVKSLDDPYTVFFTPNQNKEFLEDVGGRFEGVGMEIDIKDNQLQVVAPLEGTPAKRAGIRAGDKILEIGDRSTADITVEEAVSLIRGKKGTEVALQIFRKGWDAPKEFKIERDVIIVPSLKLEFKDDIAYLKLYQFSENANSDFAKAAAQILNSSANKIVLDLRNNPGGYLEVAQNIAGWFLEKGQAVVTEDFRDEENKLVYRASGNSSLLDYPLAVLINQGSASASEILAAALRDNRGTKLVGETSFGKGSVQELVTLTDGSSLKITVADWLTPKGEHIKKVGLKPDFEVKLTEEDVTEGKDPQLEKAIEILK